MQNGWTISTAAPACIFKFTRLTHLKAANDHSASLEILTLWGIVLNNLCQSQPKKPRRPFPTDQNTICTRTRISHRADACLVHNERHVEEVDEAEAEHTWGHAHTHTQTSHPHPQTHRWGYGTPMLHHRSQWDRSVSHHRVMQTPRGWMRRQRQSQCKARGTSVIWCFSLVDSQKIMLHINH